MAMAWQHVQAASTQGVHTVDCRPVLSASPSPGHMYTCTGHTPTSLYQLGLVAVV